MGKKIVWTPKVLEPHSNKDPQRWCKLEQHVFRNYQVSPPTKICIYCSKVEANNWSDSYLKV